MSAYFERLLEHSGLSVESAAAAQPPAEAIIPPAAPAFTQGEFVEIHEERVHETRPSTTGFRSAEVLPPPVVSITHAAETPDVAVSMQDAPIPPTVVRETATFVEETVVLASATAPAALPPLPASQPKPNVPPPPGTPEPPRAPSSAEVLQAVLRWIEAAPNDPPTSPAQVEPAPVGSPPAIAFAQDPASDAPPSPSIPERIIQIRETPASIEQPPAPAASTAVPMPERTPRAESSTESSTHVSIGTIHVRVEAPIPPPAPAAPSRVIRSNGTGRTDPNPPRSSGFSKLRRHYILPH
jgi:hypothetical protein